MRTLSFDKLDVTDSEFDELLTQMPRWRRIRSLTTCTRLPSINKQLWSEGFNSVAATLQHLSVTTYLSWSAMAEFLLSRSSVVLQQLESLTIQQYDFPLDLDFAVLPSLPRLQRFELCADTPLQTPRCTPAQIDALSRCLALTDLQCGPWIPVSEEAVTQLSPEQIQETEE